MMPRWLERVPWLVWVGAVIVVLGCGWGAWSRHCSTGGRSWTDPEQPPEGIIVPPVTMVGLGGGGTSHGSGRRSPVMRTRCYPPSLAAWEPSCVRDFHTTGVM